jgi:hypothetical protein
MDGRHGRIVTALAAALMACAGATGAPEPSREAEQPVPDSGVRHESAFPSPQELEDLGDAPVPEDLFSLDVRVLDSWRLEGPFPERVGATPYSEPTAWSALLEETIRGRAGLVVPTEAMYCVARELGRFYLAHRGQPTDHLRLFITSRCHASVAQVGFGYIDGPVTPQHSDAQLYSHWENAVAETIRNGVIGGPRTAGIWFGRSQGHAVVMVAYGYRQVRVEPFSPRVGSDGKLEIEGEVLGPAAGVKALVNRGRFGVAACESPADLKPPRFHFVCEVDRRDRATNVALTITLPSRLLSRGALSVMAWPGEETVEAYRLPDYARRQWVFENDRVPGDFTDLLNDVRREAGLGPVELDPVQSEIAAELAPHFFAAIFDRKPELTADLVVLGMIAGWSVDGIVQSGHFAAAWALRTNDLGRLLATALEYPVSREALLARDIDRIAVGPMLETTKGRESLAAVFGTYSLFDERGHEAIAAEVYEKLEADRRERGLGAPERLTDIAGPCQRAASHVKAGADPTDAMNVLLRQSVQILRAPVAGWMGEARDFEELEFPEEYLTSPSLRVAVAVTYRQPEGEPWGRYVVMLVVSDPEARGA